MRRTTRHLRIQRRVEQLLARAGVNDPPVPVERIAELCGAHVRYDHFDGDLSGLLFQQEGQIIVVVNTKHPPTRRRFTIAHEVGHLELHHHADKIHVDHRFRVQRRDARSAEGSDWEEIEANAFAAELLMPTAMLHTDLQGHLLDYEDDALIDQLADKYGVSVQAMVFRLTNLGYLRPLPTETGGV